MALVTWPTSSIHDCVLYGVGQKEVSLREYVETFKDPEDIPLYLFRLVSFCS